MDHYKKAKEIFSNYAELYQDKFMDYNVFHDTLDRFCNTIKVEKANLLEIACGPGNITKYLQYKRPNDTILATDVSPEMLTLAKNNVPSINTKLLDARAINSLSNTYHGIVCGFCLPYLNMNDVEALFISSYKLLNSNGLLYISTMEDDYINSRDIKSSSGEHSLFTHFYSETDLTSILKKAGFSIREVMRKEHSQNNDVKSNDIIIIAQK